MISPAFFLAQIFCCFRFLSLNFRTGVKHRQFSFKESVTGFTQRGTKNCERFCKSAGGSFFNGVRVRCLQIGINRLQLHTHPTAQFRKIRMAECKVSDQISRRQTCVLHSVKKIEHSAESENTIEFASAAYRRTPVYFFIHF